MFHIFFSADEKYIKYLASLLNSIVSSTIRGCSFRDYIDRCKGVAGRRSIEEFSDVELNEGYVFHVLSNKAFQKKTTSQLSQMEKLLSGKYPCNIISHIVEDDFFHQSEIPTWKGNYQAYFRFFIDRFVQDDVKFALYLDVDMLVLDDLRKLWTYDCNASTVMVADLPEVFDSDVFNSGFIFFNVRAWREGDWANKCLQYTKINKTHDQDTLNAVIDKGAILFISSEWNYCFQTFQSDDDGLLRFEEKDKLISSLKIIHYIRPKPWMNIMEWFYPSRGKCLRYQGIIDLWWKNALMTPCFSDELFDIKLKINEEAAELVGSYVKGAVFFVIRIKRWFKRKMKYFRNVTVT